MSDLFKGFEELLELAKNLEDKLQKGEIKSSFQVNSFSSIPRQGNIPRRGEREENFTSESSPNSPPIITPPPPSSSSETDQKTSISLAQLGGLGEVIRELKELVEIPLKRPELLSKLGLEPPGGVLLVGPPGTGKTLTARALATELGVNYIAIIGPEVMGKYYGEAEGKLRQIFEKASQSSPCLIFIDEIDSLAPDRSKVEGEVEKRLVAQLLGLMDGFSKRSGVILLAATNRPDHLDPALRRPGRLDREIQFRVPNREGRLEILQILTQSMPLESTVNLEEIADLSLGFVGADLKALCQKAAYLALRRQVPSLSEVIPENLTISREDFSQSLQEIKPSVLRSVSIESPQVKWEEIGGLDSIKETLKESVEGQLLAPELYQKTGAKVPRGILLWGPPGTGKTLLAKAIASQGRANFIGISGSELLSRWVGEAEQAVRELFRKARQASPCVIFVDEIDTLAPIRGSYFGDSGVSDRVVGQLLTELDGLQNTVQILLIGATNRPEAIDPALLRSGRLDLQLKIDLPGLESRLEILQVHNQNRPLEGVDLGDWAQKTEGWNGADLALFCNQAALEAIRRYRGSQMMDPSSIRIIQKDFERAFLALVSQKEM